eukprot:TRINITY_DN9655_c0_g1_i2.p1 TRINITY_DN9655_c0_g1~~TRINITY_DN9655_c0_g1_i2.p1  ORF type:complete len:213 (-),score=51.31 TRINITY_DN9655_c0_g1_i2:772-1410(-)
MINNVQPRTREEREATRVRDSIEKARIDQRVGIEARHVVVKEILHNASPQSTLFLPENERFDKDFAVYDKRERELQSMKKQQAIENHRIQIMERESLKWEQLDEALKREEERRRYHQEVNKAGKRNYNGLAFNPITLEYERSNEGELLRQRDDESKLRNFLRANNIERRSNCGYNLLTGETRFGVSVPEEMKPRYDKAQARFDEDLEWRPRK